MTNAPSPTTDKATIKEIPLQPGTSMIFFFDFGDCWEFEMLLEDVAPPDLPLTKSKILETHGQAPEQYGW